MINLKLKSCELGEFEDRLGASQFQIVTIFGPDVVPLLTFSEPRFVHLQT